MDVSFGATTDPGAAWRGNEPLEGGQVSQTERRSELTAGRSPGQTTHRTLLSETSGGIQVNLTTGKKHRRRLSQEMLRGPTQERFAEHNSYLREHPELRALLSDFLQDLLIVKPDNIFQFAREYFPPYSTYHSPRSSLKTASP
uniref:RIIa domain-containing protein n=1 Tax=Xiphophorus couchianus TaxID=32473 RepID=A0A3B5LIT4_9TELE